MVWAQVPGQSDGFLGGGGGIRKAAGFGIGRRESIKEAGVPSITGTGLLRQEDCFRGLAAGGVRTGGQEPGEIVPETRPSRLQLQRDSPVGDGLRWAALGL